MFLYYSAIIALICISMAIMIYMVAENHILTIARRRAFALFFGTVMLGSGTEWLSFLTEELHAAAVFVWLSDILYFLVPPLVALTLARTINILGKAKKMLIPYAIYAVVVVTSIFSGFIFSVSDDGVYSRGTGYWLFIAMYSLCILYFIIEMVCFLVQHRYRNKVVLILTVGFMLVGTWLQIVFPEIKTTWMLICMVSIMYYALFNELVQQVDPLTGVFNHQTFDRHCYDGFKGAQGVAVLHMRDLSKLNEEQGMDVANKCLAEIGRSLNMLFNDYGYCYRLDSSLFCVVFIKEPGRAFSICDAFEAQLESARKLEYYYMPSVTMGQSLITDSSDQGLQNALHEAQQIVAAAEAKQREDEKRAAGIA